MSGFSHLKGKANSLFSIQADVFSPFNFKRMYYRKKWPQMGIVFVLPLLFACQKNLENKVDPEEKEATDNLTVIVTTMDTEGRTLASNCFQCHGTNGYASELKIAGIGASELAEKFRSMKADGARKNIMNVHAFAYSPEEIQLIGNYFSKQ